MRTKDWHDECNESWESMVREVMGDRECSSIEWTSFDDMLGVLRTVSSTGEKNHLFLRSGGNDFLSAEASHESGCIVVNAGRIHNVINPVSVKLEYFKDDFQASYFRIEYGSLSHLGIGETCYGKEYLIESSGVYYDGSATDDGYLGHDDRGREIPLPNDMRAFRRHLYPGVFVVFSKGSKYNRDSSTYDGRQEKMTQEEFRALVDELYKKSNHDVRSSAIAKWLDYRIFRSGESFHRVLSPEEQGLNGRCVAFDIKTGKPIGDVYGSSLNLLIATLKPLENGVDYYIKSFDRLSR